MHRDHLLRIFIILSSVSSRSYNNNIVKQIKEWPIHLCLHCIHF